MRNRRAGAEGLPNSETGIEAAPSLEGSLRAVLRGLEDSRRPCAGVLSVPGFLVISRLFPVLGGFILAGKSDTFLTEEASRGDVGVKAVIPRGVPVPSPVVHARTVCTGRLVPCI